jgi:hypothetical protein
MVPPLIQERAIGQLKYSAISGSIQKIETPTSTPPENGTSLRAIESKVVSQMPAAALAMAMRNMANGIGGWDTCSEYTSDLF